ncbi:hypothetical protein F5H01DRAFT_332258 [Linnemannia elongata]|nr:hypothetical protein F5H01DRAFT_332258 [Linnemannia elongata]
MRIISLLLLELLLLLGVIILLLLLVWLIRTDEDDIGVLVIPTLRPSEPMRLCLQRTPSQRHSNFNHHEQRRNQLHEPIGVPEVARIIFDKPTSKRLRVTVIQPHMDVITGNVKDHNSRHQEQEGPEVLVDVLKS